MNDSGVKTPENIPFLNISNKEEENIKDEKLYQNIGRGGKLIKLNKRVKKNSEVKNHKNLI